MLEWRKAVADRQGGLRRSPLQAAAVVGLIVAFDRETRQAVGVVCPQSAAPRRLESVRLQILCLESSWD